MNSPEIKYLSYEDFIVILFSLVKEQLEVDPTDPLPDYRKEDNSQLNKILELVKNDAHYPGIIEKAAYLMVGIIKGHIFSNGNKRLGIVTFLVFLMINGYDLNAKTGELKDFAVYIADSNLNNSAKFDSLKRSAEVFIRQRIIKVE